MDEQTGNEAGSDNHPTYPSPSEHYKIIIEDARALGDRRETINNLFVGLFSLVAGGLGYILITFPGRLLGVLLTLVITLFGLSLCKVWEDVLGTYKALLDMRYFTLKQWERLFNFPSLQRYYASEDILYGALQSPPELAQLVPKEWIGRAGVFVSMYKILPRTVQRMFFAFFWLQIIAFLGRVVMLSLPPYLLHNVPNILLQILT